MSTNQLLLLLHQMACDRVINPDLSLFSQRRYSLIQHLDVFAGRFSCQTMCPASLCVVYFPNKNPFECYFWTKLSHLPFACCTMIGCSQTGHVGSRFGTCRRTRGARRIVSACARFFPNYYLPLSTFFLSNNNRKMTVFARDS